MVYTILCLSLFGAAGNDLVPFVEYVVWIKLLLQFLKSGGIFAKHLLQSSFSTCGKKRFLLAGSTKFQARNLPNKLRNSLE